MMTKKSVPLVGVLLLANTVLVEATPMEQGQQPLVPQVKEPIPDDIWSTIASPFDPISNPPAFAPPQRRVEQMRPRQQVIQLPQQIPQPTARSVPQVPSQPIVEDLSTPAAAPPAPRKRYPAEVKPVAVPYELPPAEKVAIAEYPEEYWNCLLNNLQGVGSDVAAKLITRACQKKHPKR